MHEHGLYASFLDPEYLYLLNEDHQVDEPSITYLENQLKQNALFGTDCFLIDVMLCDSPLLSRLFRNQHFHAFLEVNSDFLKLIADPVEGYSDDFAIVARPLQRTLADSWIASTGYTKEIKDIAKAVLDLGRLRKDDWRTVNAPIGRMLASFEANARDYIIGLLHAIEYFASPNTPRCFTPKGHRRVDFRFYLHRIANSDLSVATRSLADRTLQLLKDCDVEDSPTRSSLTRRYSIQELRTAHRDSWGLIVQAWNLAVAESNGIAWRHIAAINGSQLPNIGFDVGATAVTRVPQIPESSYVVQPSKLSWLDVKNAVNDTALDRVLIRLATSDAAASDALKAASRSLARHLSTKNLASLQPFFGLGKSSLKHDTALSASEGVVGFVQENPILGFGLNFVAPAAKAMILAADGHRERFVSGLIYKELRGTSYGQ